MSLAYSTACLDCDVFAPEVGAAGYIGYPSADTSRGREDQPPNFGYLYEAFAGIQLIPWHLDLLHHFFHQHLGHRIQTFAEGEPVLGKGSPGAKAPEPQNDALRPFALQESQWTDATSSAYPLARFRVHCAGCNAEYISEASDNIRRFAPVTVSTESINRFLKRMEGQLDSSTFMNAAPLDCGEVAYPDLAALLMFLRDHQAHPLGVSMVSDA